MCVCVALCRDIKMDGPYFVLCAALRSKYLAPEKTETLGGRTSGP